MKFTAAISARLFPLLCALALVCAGAVAETPAHSPAKKTVSTQTSSPKKAKKKKSRKKTSWRRGQQKIDKQRATEIQKALIRQHYLDGEPSGVWDQKTQSALQRYQGDNGWQTKTTPDSRALIKLGLGPDQQHLLNPESAMTTAPPVPESNRKSPSPAEPSGEGVEVPKIPNHLRK